MAYKNIVFVKLEKRLLNDPRWWTMSSYAQLIYIKLMLLAAETYNKIPLNDEIVRQAVRCELGLVEFRRCMDEIRINFPRLKKNKHFMYFQEFETKTNWLPSEQLLSNRRAIAKTAAYLDLDQDKEKEKEKKPPTPKKNIGLFRETTEKKIKEKIAETNHHKLGSEANEIAFNKLVSDIARDKTIKKPAAVALWRAGRSK